MKGRALWTLGWGGVLLLCWPWQPGTDESQGSLGRRLLGPVASLVSSAEWVRFDWWVREGRYERAYAAAERALALDPAASQGWIHLAHNLAFLRASLENEPDSTRRRRWIEAGLELLERGETQAAEPADLAYYRGLILSWVADLEGLGPPVAPGWPGGVEGALAAGAAAFHVAGQRGNLQGYAAERRLRTRESPPPPGTPSDD